MPIEFDIERDQNGKLLAKNVTCPGGEPVVSSNSKRGFERVVRGGYRGGFRGKHKGDTIGSEGYRRNERDAYGSDNKETSK